MIDRKVNKYIAALDGISKKLEKDKVSGNHAEKAVAQLQENRFDLLEEVKTVNIGNEMAVTISIGIGLDGLTYAQNYEFARTAIDLALGRGGDQAVIKTPESITYYGGKSQQVEKNTRVKARVKLMPCGKSSPARIVSLSWDTGCRMWTASVLRWVFTGSPRPSAERLTLY